MERLVKASEAHGSLYCLTNPSRQMITLFPCGASSTLLSSTHALHALDLTLKLYFAIVFCLL